MSLFKTLGLQAVGSVFMDVLFPVPKAEQAVLSLDGKNAWKSLPRATHVPLPEACAAFSYKDERVWRLVWSIKYKKSRAGAAIAAYALYRIIGLFVRAVPEVVIIPLPITRRRRRERGFNQCELIADEIEKLDREKTSAKAQFVIVRDLLVRVRHTSRQTLKDKSGRENAARDLFAVNSEALKKVLEKNGERGIDIKSTLLIIIDDVITTGSTMKEAIRTMREAGFERTFGLSVAH